MVFYFIAIGNLATVIVVIITSCTECNL